MRWHRDALGALGFFVMLGGLLAHYGLPFVSSMPSAAWVAMLILFVGAASMALHGQE